MILDNILPPSVPIREPWELSIGDLIRRRYNVPGMADKALSCLDRCGALRLSPEVIGFDDCDVEWSKLQEIRTRPIAEALTRTALDREIERARKLLPPVPGRKWILHKVGEELGELCRAALSKRAPESSSRIVPSELLYRGTLGRTKVLSGGMVVTAMLTGIPGTATSIVSTARLHGIPIVGDAESCM